MNEKIEEYLMKNMHIPNYTLQLLADKLKSKHLNELFSEQVDRFEQFCLHYDDISFDFSKHRIDIEIIIALVEFANKKQLDIWIKDCSLVRR
jgi:glucose-6-phosphate isomerase